MADSQGSSNDALRIPSEIRALLVCPRCHGELRDVRAEQSSWLACEACHLRYPVEAGIPVLLIERASAWQSAV